MKPDWIPACEVYCHKCRRMVAATESGAMLVHFRFNLDKFNVVGGSIPCRGWIPIREVTQGREDSNAAFWPAEPDTPTEPEVEPAPVATSADAAPRHRFSFVRRNPV